MRLDPSVHTSLREITSTLVRGNPDIRAALVVDDAGSAWTSQEPGDVESLETVAVAFSVPLRELLDRVAAELGCGLLKSTLVEGESGSLALADVDGASTAILVGVRGATPGALRADALRLAKGVRDLGSSPKVTSDSPSNARLAWQ